MAQSTDATLSNQLAASFRTELNSILQAILTCHKGSTEPTYKVVGMNWLDDTGTPWVLKQYDGSNWIARYEINASTDKWGIINLQDGDARTEAANIGQIQDFKFTYIGTSSGTNTITASATPAITAYVAGQMFSFRAGGTNTGATTININGVGAKTIQKRGGALAAGDITANNIVWIAYDGTQFQMLSPGAPYNLGTDSVTPDNIDTSVNVMGNLGGGSRTINLASGLSVSATVNTSTTTLSFTNPKASGDETIFTLRLTNGGSQVVNWPASVDWAGGAAPTLTASGVDELTFKTVDGGTTWAGAYMLDVK